MQQDGQEFPSSKYLEEETEGKELRLSGGVESRRQRGPTFLRDGKEYGPTHSFLVLSRGSQIERDMEKDRE